MPTIWSKTAICRRVKRRRPNNTFEFLLNGLFAIVNDPQSQTVEIDDSAVFEVSARGGSKPYRYQWEVSRNGQNGSFMPIDGADDKSLVLEAVTEADNGQFYRCIVTDAAGRKATSAPALLLVQSHPFVIVQQPTDQTVPEGQNAQFFVAAEGGNQPYAYQWQISTNGENGAFTNVPNAEESVLLLENVTVKEQEEYFRCVVTDSVGRRVTSNAARLEVSKIPNTGDGTPVELLFAMGAVSVLLMLLLMRKRKDNKILKKVPKDALIRHSSVPFCVSSW